MLRVRPSFLSENQSTTSTKPGWGYTKAKINDDIISYFFSLTFFRDSLQGRDPSTVKTLARLGKCAEEALNLHQVLEQMCQTAREEAEILAGICPDLRDLEKTLKGDSELYHKAFLLKENLDQADRLEADGGWSADKALLAEVLGLTTEDLRRMTEERDPKTGPICSQHLRKYEEVMTEVRRLRKLTRTLDLQALGGLYSRARETRLRGRELYCGILDAAWILESVKVGFYRRVEVSAREYVRLRGVGVVEDSHALLNEITTRVHDDYSR